MAAGKPFFIDDNGNNEVYCGSNYPDYVTCYYYGTLSGEIAEEAIMGLETMNLFIIDLSSLVEEETLSISNIVSVSIPCEAELSESNDDYDYVSTVP